MLDVGLIDAGVRHDETQPVRDDQHVLAIADDVVRLGENDLDQARVLLHIGRHFDGTRRCHDVAQVDVPSLGLGHDFLRNHEHIAVARRNAGAPDAVCEDGGEIVPGLDQRKPFDGRQRDRPVLRRHAYVLSEAPNVPVIRNPAPASTL